LGQHVARRRRPSSPACPGAHAHDRQLSAPARAFAQHPRDDDAAHVAAAPPDGLT
jgi:hypothetical protein